MITLKINDRAVEVEEGSTILQAAKKIGVFIPTFCYDDLERMPAKYEKYDVCAVCLLSNFVLCDTASGYRWNFKTAARTEKIWGDAE